MTTASTVTEIPILNLITDHLDRQVDERPDQDFLVLGDTRLTYRATKALVDDTARALMASGVEVGDRVAMLSAPRPEFFAHFLAVTSIGAIWLGLNPKYTIGELDHVVSDAEPKLIFGFLNAGGDDQTDKLSELSASHGWIEQMVLFDGSSAPEQADGVGSIGRSVGWDAFLERADETSEEELATRRTSLDPMTPALLVYTSGSTGRPKGAMLTHRGSNLCNVIAIERKALSERSIICNLPINHIGAVGDICERTMTGGGTLYFQENFNPVGMMELIQDEGLNTIAGVPTMLQMCMNHPDLENYDLTSVDLIAWGGAAMPAELLSALMDKCDCRRATMGYGMSETTGGVTYSGLFDSIDLLVSTVGTPDERQPSRIWHPDGHVAEVGEPGEIQVKGDFVMTGYWRLPEATAAAFTDDGWFCTGDLAMVRPDGFVEIVGRMSEMFKSGGYNVYPREVELALEEHERVAMAAVISIPDPKFQEVGVAYLMGSGRHEIDPDAISTFVRERLANYKVPKQIVVLDELPMLPIGKVDKVALRAMALGEAAPADKPSSAGS